MTGRLNRGAIWRNEKKAKDTEVDFTGVVRGIIESMHDRQPQCGVCAAETLQQASKNELHS